MRGVTDCPHEREVSCRFMSARPEVNDVVIERFVPGVTMTDLVFRPDDQ